ncbi:hypothetical protein Amsp01_094270 [Amycolatopsis sp. NBRC 101858]|nr:hypothetical protein Amsp01_094270 [Amycolatopsis sp. NBRC 101858]
MHHRCPDGCRDAVTFGSFRTADPGTNHLRRRTTAAAPPNRQPVLASRTASGESAPVGRRRGVMMRRGVLPVLAGSVIAAFASVALVLRTGDRLTSSFGNRFLT